MKLQTNKLHKCLLLHAQVLQNGISFSSRECGPMSLQCAIEPATVAVQAAESCQHLTTHLKIPPCSADKHPVLVIIWQMLAPPKLCMLPYNGALVPRKSIHPEYNPAVLSMLHMRRNPHPISSIQPACLCRTDWIV